MGRMGNLNQYPHSEMSGTCLTIWPLLSYFGVGALFANTRQLIDVYKSFENLRLTKFLIDQTPENLLA